MLQLSSDQQSAIWAGIAIAKAIQSDHVPEFDQGWQHLAGLNDPRLLHVEVQHADLTVVERVRAAIESIVGASPGTLSGNGANVLCLPKP